MTELNIDNESKASAPTILCTNQIMSSEPWRRDLVNQQGAVPTTEIN